MGTTARTITLAAITAFIAVACSPQTRVVKLYHESSAVTAPYKHLLVIDISGDTDRRLQFENEIVRRIKEKHGSAVQSYTLLKSSDGVLQEDVNRIGDEAGADGILVTHIVSVDTRVDLEKGREELMTECRGGDPVDYFLYEHKVLREPDSIKLAHTVTVVASLYDAASQERVWTVQSTCFEKSTFAEVLFDEAEAIAWQLRLDKLI